MVRKYITRDFTNHIHTTEYLSDEDEYIKFEMFSFDPDYTRTYIVENNTLKGENCKKTNYKSWTCFQSKNKIDPMEFTLNYNAKTTGQYRIDIIYEQDSHMFEDNDYNTHKDLVGWYDIYLKGSKSEHTATIHKIKKPKRDTKLVDINDILKEAKVSDMGPISKKFSKKKWDLDSVKKMEKTILKGFAKMGIYYDPESDMDLQKFLKLMEEINNNNIDKPTSAVDLKFEGENNVLKRKTIFKDLNKGNYNIEFGVPHNCYVIGAIIRKIIVFTGTNDDEAGTNLQFTQATLTNSEMLKPTELQVTVGYDDDFECENSPSGLYMDYMDECNLYVRNSEGDIERIFGGYVSTPLPDKDRRKITIHCADRLRDGQNKYILDELVMQGGDGNDSEYDKNDVISFNKHGEVLRYLCELYEVSLKNNIEGGYVENEKYDNGFTVVFGKKKRGNVKNVKKIDVSNGSVKFNNKSVQLRNNSSGKRKQTWTLWKAKKIPVDISNYKNFHITYGMGNPRTEHKRKDSIVTDVADSTAGSQKFGKCGVSQDNKYLMAIGKPSAGGDTGSGWTKTIFERKCPCCGSSNLVWDWNWGSYSSCRGANEGGTAEGHIFCKSCDADWSVQGKSHENRAGYCKKSVKKKSSTVKSSRSEAQKLKNGEMAGVPSGDVSISAEDIFKAIKKATKGWKHSTGTGSTASYLEKHHVGDCFAWSEKISKELKRYKVNHKIVEYNSGVVSNHRSVLYQKSNGEYDDFPYREYNFPNGTYNTSGSKNGRVIYNYKQGGRISQAKTSKNTKKNETVETLITNGYDIKTPFQAYIDIVYSTTQSLDSKKYHVYVDFTQKAKSNYSMSGLNPVWVNNQSKKLTLNNFIDKLREYRNHSADTRIYIHSVSFITPKIKVKTKEDKADWYTYDEHTIDESSCKIKLYSIAFNNQTGTVPGGLSSCGRGVNEIMKNIVDGGNYLVSMTYGKHRADDKINFRVDNNSDAVFVAREGNDNNILEWGNINYNPANELYNMSRCVFKKNKTEKYFYVDSKFSESILKYQEQCTLITENEAIGEKEAYWNARHNEKFNPEQTYSYTITVMGCPDVELKDLVSVTANSRKLNTLKEVESITLKYDHKSKPILQTELGLGELAPDLQVRQTIRNLRNNAKKSTTDFGSSAKPISDESIYEWEN